MDKLAAICGGKRRGAKKTCWADTRKGQGRKLNISDLRRGSCDVETYSGFDDQGEMHHVQGPHHHVHKPEDRQAYVTLATNDTYALGCLTLGESLKRAATTKELVVMITRHVSDAMVRCLEKTFDFVQLFDVMDSADSANLAMLQRPELGVTLTKIHCWTLTDFDKAVFLDADTLVLRNCDELFDQYGEFSAAPDVGWPDCFNSGVFVFRPSIRTYKSLLHFASTNGSFDGGDQGLLNSFFHEWPRGDIKKHLPFIYNMVASIIYTYTPAFKRFAGDVKIIHFLGPTKPWQWNFDVHDRRMISDLGHLGETADLLTLWWNVFISRVLPNTSEIQLVRAFHSK
ncbi:hypothetical protein RvY_00561-2 [Ramazzottius varieornatus]|uniref:glycogenin glucosyltransferase n=1 Tax=Ramazzottius varieornatus TaxID=947166 RepID=A0A1D1UGU5_RAMVA|nr:hypothetical protein RvY_00561-2 [Ramazzottius varieornatus]